MNYKLINDSIDLEAKKASLFFTDTQETKTYDMIEDDGGWHIDLDGEKVYLLVPTQDE